MTKRRGRISFAILGVALAVNDCGGRSRYTDVVPDPNGPRTGDAGIDASAGGNGGAGASETTGGAETSSSAGLSSDSCGVERDAYALRRAELLKAYQAGCEFSEDCVLLVEDNACSYDCAVPVLRQRASDLVQALDAVALDGCAMCAPPERAACRMRQALCFAGTCVPMASGAL